jgi:hypothetical protein
MTAVANVLTRATGTHVDVETLRPIIILCGFGLSVSLLLAAYGFDLGAGFF